MNGAEDLQKLTQNFMEMWQKQLLSSMNDPALVDMALAMTRAMQGQMPHTTATSHEANDAEKRKTTRQSAGASDTTLSADGELSVSEFRVRLRACEARIAELESELRALKRRDGGVRKKSARKAAGTARKRK